MVNGRFIDLEHIAEASGCDIAAANQVAIKVMESLHKSVLVNGLSGSLHEALMCLSPEAAYHLGGLYTVIGDRDSGTAVQETLLRLPPYEDYIRCREQMDAWEATLTEVQRHFVRIGQEKD